jgi:hypothetical protein
MWGVCRRGRFGHGIDPPAQGVERHPADAADVDARDLAGSQQLIDLRSIDPKHTALAGHRWATFGEGVTIADAARFAAQGAKAT